MDEVDVVLLNPPFFRFCGSHNNRLPPSLSYLSAYLEAAGISHALYNADYTESKRFWSMKWMFDNFDPFIDAVDGKGSLYGEVVEIVQSFRPKAVVIMGGEPLIATKDWGNPFIAAHYARMLRRMNVFTVGLSHFFTLDRSKFEDAFDCIMGGEPNAQIVDIIRKRVPGYVSPQPLDLNVVPNLKRQFPTDQDTDFVMTSFGCRFPCSFCLVQQLYRELDQRVRFVETDTVMRDLQQRSESEIYLTDLTFTFAPPKRLRELADALGARGIQKSFTVEARVDCLTERTADLLTELNVRCVKLGVEGITKDLLRAFNKRTKLAQIERAVGLLKERGIAVVTYLLIGGVTSEEDYELTRSYIEKLAPDFVPVAIWSYDLTTDYRYDTQFSPTRLNAWGIDRSVYFKYMDLQSEMNPTVGKMLDYVS